MSLYGTRLPGTLTSARIGNFVQIPQPTSRSVLYASNLNMLVEANPETIFAHPTSGAIGGTAATLRSSTITTRAGTVQELYVLRENNGDLAATVTVTIWDCDLDVATPVQVTLSGATVQANSGSLSHFFATNKRFSVKIQVDNGSQAQDISFAFIFVSDV